MLRIHATATTGTYTLSLHDALPISRRAGSIRPGRMMIIGCVLWYALIAVFAQMTTPAAGIAALFLAGLAQSLGMRSEEHTSELQSRLHLVCRLLLEKKNKLTASTPF